MNYEDYKQFIINYKTFNWESRDYGGNDFRDTMKFKHSFLRNLSSNLTKLILDQIMGTNQTRYINSFRIFKKSLMNNFVYQYDLNDPSCPYRMNLVVILL